MTNIVIRLLPLVVSIVLAITKANVCERDSYVSEARLLWIRFGGKASPADI